MIPLTTPIRMEDGSLKLLRDVAIGDRVLDSLFNRVNTVIGLERCNYCHRFTDGTLPRRVFSINGQLDLTGTHLIRGVGTWAVVEFDVYDAYVRQQPSSAELIKAGGPETVTYKPIASAEIVPFGPVLSIPLPRAGGQVVASQVEEVTEEYALDPDFEMGALAVDGSHIIEAGGFFIGGWPHDDDFDYDAGVPL